MEHSLPGRRLTASAFFTSEFTFLHCSRTRIGFYLIRAGTFPGTEEVMRSGNWKIVSVLSGLALATIIVPCAHAGCGLYSPVRHVSWQPGTAMPRLVSAAFIINRDGDERSEPSMVGTW